MKIQILTCSSKTPPWLNDLVAEYEKKIGFWIAFQFKCLKSPSVDRDQSHKKIKSEGELFLEEIKPYDYVLVCDERGTAMDSMAFSKKIGNLLASGKKRLVVVIGGAYGLDERVLARADLTVNLAPFTMNHHMASAVISEQVYRAMTILKGTPYHNA